MLADRDRSGSDAVPDVGSSLRDAHFRIQPVLAADRLAVIPVIGEHMAGVGDPVRWRERQKRRQDRLCCGRVARCDLVVVAPGDLGVVEVRDPDRCHVRSLSA
jgi:hypothetical protein